MKALAIDTVTEMCSVALSLDGEVLVRQQLAPNSHSNQILGMVKSVLEEGCISLKNLDLIACDVGPGSFTGIRIGIGVAQGLAYGADLPIVGVDSLSALAHGVQREVTEDIFAAIDARMGQVYWARFHQQRETLVLDEALHLGSPDSIEIEDVPLFGVGSGVDEYVERLQKKLNISHYAKGCFPLAVDALAIGVKVPRDNWLPAGGLMPVYLRNDVAKVSKKIATS